MSGHTHVPRAPMSVQLTKLYHIISYVHSKKDSRNHMENAFKVTLFEKLKKHHGNTTSQIEIRIQKNPKISFLHQKTFYL